MTYEELKKFMPKYMKHAHWEVVKKSGWIGTYFFRLHSSSVAEATKFNSELPYSGRTRRIGMFIFEFELESDAMLFKLSLPENLSIRK